MAHIPDWRESRRVLAQHFAKLNEHRYDWRRLVPSQCPLCEASCRGGGLCPRCHQMITTGMRKGPPRCVRCCLQLDADGSCPDCVAVRPAFDGIIAAFDYAEPADLLIHRLKVARRFTDVPMLGGLLADQVRHAWPDRPADLVLVPVPASNQAIRQRGFNPAAEVARTLARSLRCHCRPQILRREHEGRKQATLGREARMMATARLYQVAQDVSGARIAVVDDVMTTGSTMHSIARMLKRSGALSVHGLVLARTPRFSS